MKLLRLLIFFAVVAAMPAATPVSAAKAPVWELVRLDDTVTDADERETIETTTRDGVLYITVTHPVKVEIYSILGQLITSRQLKPGTVRLTLNQRGVYILKAGSVTRRINL